MIKMYMTSPYSYVHDEGFSNSAAKCYGLAVELAIMIDYAIPVKFVALFTSSVTTRVPAYL